MRRILTVSPPLGRILFPLILATALVMPRPASAEMSYVTKTLLWGLGGAIIGTGTSYFINKNKDNINLPLTLVTWGGVGAVAGLGTGLLVTSEVSKIEKMEIQVNTLRAAVDNYKKKESGQFQVSDFNLPYGNLPTKYRHLVKDMKFEEKRVNHWTQVDDNPNSLRSPHVIVTIYPPKLSPAHLLTK